MNASLGLPPALLSTPELMNRRIYRGVDLFVQKIEQNAVHRVTPPLALIMGVHYWTQGIHPPIHIIMLK